LQQPFCKVPEHSEKPHQQKELPVPPPTQNLSKTSAPNLLKLSFNTESFRLGAYSHFWVSGQPKTKPANLQTQSDWKGYDPTRA
jgi:hypothetical protein